MGKTYETMRVTEIMSQGGNYATQVQVRAYNANGQLSDKYVYLDLIGFDKNGNLSAYDFKLSVNSPL